jgi:quinoprotein glucose dehydrogenase
MATIVARALLLVMSGGVPLCAAAIGQQAVPAPVAVSQLERGMALYAQQCATCHGATMRGGDDGTALTGARFARKWYGRPVYALFEKTRITMPQDDPGTLRPDQAADLTAAILSANDVRPGSGQLSLDPEALKRILIGQPEEPASAKGVE